MTSSFKNTTVASGTLKIATGTHAQRPSPTTGHLRFNSDYGTYEIYNGSAWVQAGGGGASDTIFPAKSAAALSAAGFTGKGYFWIDTPNGGPQLTWCDLDTADEDGNKGWMLVASWSTGSSWRNSTATTRATLSGTAGANRWSANFGDFLVQKMRVTANSSVATTLGSSAAADWYYHWSTRVPWKSVWSWRAGTNNNWINDTSGDSNGNINAFAGWPEPINNANTAVPRVCMRGFNWAYNIKYSYKASTQRWVGFSDGGGSGTAQSWSDFWTGLTAPGVTIDVSLPGGDGNIAIIPSGTTYTTAGQDCDHNQSKVGYDDTAASYYYGASATADMNTNNANTGTDYPLWFWIK